MKTPPMLEYWLANQNYFSISEEFFLIPRCKLFENPRPSLGFSIL
jgi:hypothetical protein